METLNRNLRNGLYAFFAIFCLLSSSCLSSKASNINLNKGSIAGKISNYNNNFVYLHKCYGDTVVLIDSVVTSSKGEFKFDETSLSKGNKFGNNTEGLYKITLSHTQFFFVLNDGGITRIKTTFQENPFYNIANDSLAVLYSEENKLFFEFQRLQTQLNVASQWLIQMLRVFPIADPFHPGIELEYVNRHKKMDELIIKLINTHPNTMAAAIAKAFYVPVIPDWKEPDPDRNQIIAKHYFDYFDPCNKFYLQTNILPEKIESWFALFDNHRYNEKWHEERYKQAAEQFLAVLVKNDNTVQNYRKSSNYDFVLNYILKIMQHRHFDDAFLTLYDKYLIKEDNCSPSDTYFNWARAKAEKLRKIQIGNIAPDFTFSNLNNAEGLLTKASTLYELKSEYTLVVFWASWCPHCTQMLPELKKYYEIHNGKSLQKNFEIVAVSIDNELTKWQNAINDLEWINCSELKGWQGNTIKAYNVYATPTMLLLDKNKKIIAKPRNVDELSSFLLQIFGKQVSNYKTLRL